MLNGSHHVNESQRKETLSEYESYLASFSISHCLASNPGFIQDNIPYVPIYSRNHEYLKDLEYYVIINFINL